MASYKSAIRTPAPTTEQPESKFKEKARQLQEFFPSWSQDDLQSLLTEVNGDVEVAATRISDGKAEQWGSVSRKKDKKSAHAPKESVSSTPSFRGDFRGGRGGARGGRGGSARGGAAVRGARGEFRGGRGGHLNGHTPRTSSPAVGQNPDNKASDASKPISDNAVSDSTPETWNEVSNPEENSSLGVGIAGDSTSAWSAPTNTNAWGATDTASDHSSAQANANVNGSTPTTTSHAPAPTTAKPFFKSLATSKLSWAQVARPQDKTTPSTPAPIGQQQQQQQSLRPAPEPIPSANAPSLSTRTSAPPEPEPSVNTGWEDPTTVQTPSFDEEPSIPTVSSEPAKVELEPEAASTSHEPTPSKPTETVAVEAPPSVTPSTPAPSTPAPSTPSKVAARPAAVAQRHSARYSNYAKIASDQGGVVMPPTPSSIGTNLSGLSSFGTFGDFKSNVDKVGMQFGSLSLGGASEPESEPEAASAPLPVSTTEASAQTPASAPEATAPSTSASLNSGLYQPQPQPLQASVSQPAVSSSPSIPTVAASSVQSLQQQSASTQPHSQSQSLSQLPQQLQQQTTQQTHHHYVQHGLPTHVEPSSQSQNQTQSPPQQVPQTQQQHYLRQNDQSPYGSVVTNNVSSGFSHSPTPPQDNNGYGAFGSGLGSQGLGGQGLGLTSQALGGMGQAALGGVAGLGGMGGLGQGLGHQQQQSVSTFDSYGYEGGQRSFYESYQPNAFGGRSVLGHDDLKAGMPSQQQAQQAPSTASTGSSSNNLPSSSSQSSVPQSQQSPATSVSSPQGQPQPGQGPAPTGYHPAAPVPTYYYQPFPQNSYYGAATMGAPSNYGYGVGGMGVPQPYPGINVGKYPTMYPGPPGNAPSPAGKPSPGMGVVNHGHGSVIGHGGLGVQPQNYAAGLYGQQQGYDDYSHHSQPQHHQQQGHQHHTSHGLGLGQDYSKQLYGAQGGLQGYMSGAGAGSAATGAGPRGGQSPETAYKPYAPKDVGVGRGNVQQGQGQGQGQSQGQAQGQGQGGGPQGQGFYAGNRFGGGGNVGGGPQQSAHSAPLYPQGQNDAGYYYQQRQQQYWQ